MDELLSWFEAQNPSARTYASLAQKAYELLAQGHAHAAALRLIADQAMNFFLKYQDEPLSADEGARAFARMRDVLKDASAMATLDSAGQLRTLNRIAMTNIAMPN